MPRLSVVVPAHARPLRLRWLLNALEAQTLPREEWEVVVCHDAAGEEIETLLSEHPLATSGTLRHLRLPPGTGTVGRQRNAAWREARARRLPLKRPATAFATRMGHDGCERRAKISGTVML